MCDFWCVYTMHEFYLLKQNKNIYEKDRKKPSLPLQGQTRRWHLWRPYWIFSARKLFFLWNTQIWIHTSILKCCLVVLVRSKNLIFKLKKLHFDILLALKGRSYIYFFFNDFSLTTTFFKTDSTPQENSLPFPFHSNQAFKKIIKYWCFRENFHKNPFRSA